MNRLTAFLAIVLVVLVASLTPRSAPDVPPGREGRSGAALGPDASLRATFAAPLPVPIASSVTGEPIPASISGNATWYDAPSSHDAAAGPSLRKALGSHWRHSTVKVCAKRCIVVRLTDWCACPHRVIDLDDRAFAKLAPLSAGIVAVRVTVVGAIDVPSVSRPTAPPTDVTP